MKKIAIATLVLASSTALSAPVSYEIDPNHTFPSFSADHMGGLSQWRGKVNSTSGKITLDKEKSSGAVEIVMDMNSIDFGHDQLNTHVKSAEMLDVAKFPTATFKGALGQFKNGFPTAVVGTLTLHGVTKPVTLKVDHFLCIPNDPIRKREVCGADASAQINRSDFGVGYGTEYGFKPEVALQIQVEAMRAQ